MWMDPKLPCHTANLLSRQCKFFGELYGQQAKHFKPSSKISYNLFKISVSNKVCHKGSPVNLIKSPWRCKSIRNILSYFQSTNDTTRNFWHQVSLDNAYFPYEIYQNLHLLLIGFLWKWITWTSRLSMGRGSLNIMSNLSPTLTVVRTGLLS